MRLTKMLRGFQSTLRDESGTSVIELAIFAPVGAVLLLGLADISLAFSEKLRVEQAAQRAVEKATSYGGAGSDYSNLDDEAAAEANVPISDVVLDKWLTCDWVRQNNFDDICGFDQQIGRHISIMVNASYTPLFKYGPLGTAAGINTDGKIHFRVKAGVRIQ